MDSLSQQISDLINPLPTLIDPEDDIDVETSAKTVLKSETIPENDVKDNEDISLLRRKKTQNLSEINKRYSGIKVDRKLLEDLDSNGGESEDSDKDLHKSGSDVCEDMEFYGENIRAPMASSEELEDKSDSVSSDSTVDEEVDQQVMDKDMNEMNEYFNEFSRIDVKDETQKGFALKNQFIIFDNLLKCRIKLQKVLSDCNKYPQFLCLSQLKNSDPNQLNPCLKETTKAVKKLLNILIDIDSTIDSDNDLLPNQRHSSQTNAETDEESDEKTDNSIEFKTKLSSKRKLSDYSEILSKRHCDLSDVRNKVLDKWYEKTRFTSNSFKTKSMIGMESLEQSSTQQIDRILSDMERLVRRTQIKRSLYSIIGKTDINDKTFDTNKSNEEIGDKSDDLDPEIFDDDDFYHQLLRELIDSKTGIDSNDSMALSRKWIEIQKLRNKLKRKVDTKASKGRKIRYDVHSKLVNYMAPVANCSYTEEATNELFGSLFGQNIN